jgi:hypothetical protein
MNIKLMILIYLTVVCLPVVKLEDFYSSMGKMTTLITTVQEITKTLEEIIIEQDNQLEMAKK